jgi:hypothetical protein
MRFYRLAAGSVGWFALILQYVLMVQAGWTLNVTVNFFSYFTILSNLLAALALFVPVFMPSAFRSGSLRTGVALYMTVTGLIYVTVLRNIWDPQGWAFVADALLHYMMPVLYLIDWVLFAEKRSLRYGDVPRWLIFPALYAGYSLLRGSVADWYPYPFLDVSKLGAGPVAINVMLVVALFACLGFALAWIGRHLPARLENTQRSGQ